MEVKTVEAVFENGVFRPLNPHHISIQEGQHVRLVIAATETAADILNLADQVYEDLSLNDIADIEQIALTRRPFFGEDV